MSLFSRVGAVVGKLPRAHTHKVSVDRDVPVPMPDGAVLLADRWYPTETNPIALPIVLVRTPYGRRQMGIVGRIFAERGYQVVMQSVRGTFGSGGEWVPLMNERADGAATLDWLAAQPWFSGTVGTWGGSYLGLTQWSITADAPDFVKAMAPSITSSFFPEVVTYPGGSFALETTLSWVYQVEHQELGLWRMLRSQAQAKKVLTPGYTALPLADADRTVVGRHVDFFQQWLAHDGQGDPYWAPIDFRKDITAAPPSTLVGGWYDVFLPAQVDDFVALRDAGRSPRLTIGPWSHTSVKGGRVAMRDSLQWFDAHLRGDRSRLPAQPVRIFVMGSGRWVDLPDWPPPATQESWYLQGGGGLAPRPPGQSAPDRYRYDPADPTPGIGGASLALRNNGPKDNRVRESRADVLTFTSDPLDRGLTIAGPLTATLYLRSSLEHTDFFVRLCDVDEKGKSVNLSDGIIRLRPGEVDKQADGSFVLRVAMWPTANEFKAGHRVRLQVSSGAHPIYARNPGTGDPLGHATTMRVADQEVLHDPDHPSALELPVSTL